MAEARAGGARRTSSRTLSAEPRGRRCLRPTWCPAQLGRAGERMGRRVGRRGAEGAQRSHAHGGWRGRERPGRFVQAQRAAGMRRGRSQRNLRVNARALRPRGPGLGSAQVPAAGVLVTGRASRPGAAPGFRLSSLRGPGRANAPPSGVRGTRMKQRPPFRTGVAVGGGRQERIRSAGRPSCDDALQEAADGSVPLDFASFWKVPKFVSSFGFARPPILLNNTEPGHAAGQTLASPPRPGPPLARGNPAASSGRCHVAR